MWSEILDRANLQTVCGFLLYGMESAALPPVSLAEKCLEESTLKLQEFLEEKFPGWQYGSPLEKVLNDMQVDTREFYFALGFSAGLLLQKELLDPLSGLTPPEPSC